MDRSLIRDMAEERAINALSYIAHYQEGDDMEALRDVAATALDEWAEARKSTDRPEGPGEGLPRPGSNPSPNPTPHPHEVRP